MKIELEVLTPDSPRWDEFADRLMLMVGTQGCEHGHHCARAVLEKMGGIDVEASLIYFADHGGYCDCEILFNVDPACRIFAPPLN